MTYPSYTGWHPWLGLPHRIGADPRNGEACCCLRMAQIIMEEIGRDPPEIDPRWENLARERRWTDLYEEFQLIAIKAAVDEELWSLVPLLTPASFGIGVVVPDKLLLVVHHRQGLTTVPLLQLKSPLYYNLR